MNQPRYKLVAAPDTLGPASWTTYYALGVALSKRMPSFLTFDEIGAHLGLSKQNAYTECMLALGKLAYGLKAELLTAPDKPTRRRQTQ